MATTLAAPGWTPDPRGLRTVVGMLHETTTGADPAGVYARLQAYATRADFNKYLAYILAHGDPAAAGASHAVTSAGAVAVASTSTTDTVRQAAGLLLKNNLKHLYKTLTPEIRTYINNELLSAIGDNSRLVRSAVAVCITAIVSKAGLQVWPDLFPTLVSCLDSKQDAFLDGALNALARICEDAPELLDSDPSQPLDVIIPKLLAFFEHPNDAVRVKVVHILNQFLLVMPPALSDNIDVYLAALFRVAQDASFEVRRRVCSAICMLLESRPDALAKHLPDIVQYMVNATGDSSEVVALEACEFWNVFAAGMRSQEATATVRSVLGRLVPLLLTNMVYSEDERAAFDAEDEEENDKVADRAEDARPRFHSSRFVKPSHNSDGAPAAGVASRGYHASTCSPQSTATASPSAPDEASPISRSGSEIGNTTHVPLGAGLGEPHYAKQISGANFNTSGIGSCNERSTFTSNGTAMCTGTGTGIDNVSRLEGNHALRNLDRASLQQPLPDASLSNPVGIGSVTANNIRSVVGGHGVVGGHNTIGDEPSSSHMNMLGSRLDESDDEAVDDDEYDDGEWNLRKGSASALDALAGFYGDEILPVLLPALQSRLENTTHWEQRECGVLALGAISDGCYVGVAPHLPVLFPYLLNSLHDVHHRARVMSCWTLSRYSRWVLEQKDDAMLTAVLRALCERMLDRNKTVQRSACSALSVLQEHAGLLIVAYILPILQTIDAAFERYQQNNLVALYDTVCTLADAVGSELANPDYVKLCMPPLIQRWSVMQDDDLGLGALFGCLTCVFRALGPASQQFVLPIFTRCVTMVEAMYSAEASGRHESVNSERLTICLDLMCGLCEALGPAIDPLLVQPANGRANLLQLLYFAMKDGRHEVRQSAFALVGEFARTGMPSLVPVLLDYVGVVVDALNPQYMRCANNATWALGEIIMMAGFLPRNVPLDREAVRKPLLEHALPSLIRIVNIPQLNRSLLENTAITLGRLGLVMPESVAPRLQDFAEPMLSALREIRDDADKEHAFSGVNAMIKLNPTALLKCFALYLDAVVSWLHSSPKLEAEFASILVGYKNSLGDQWPLLYATCPADLQLALKGRFGL